MANDMTSELLRQLIKGAIRRPRRPSRAAAWGYLTELGMTGGLAALLNEQVVPATELPLNDRQGLREILESGKRQAARRQLPHRSPWGPARYLTELGREIRDEFKRNGWLGVQLRLLWHSVSNRPLLQSLWRSAMTEALLFARARFSIGWCEYGSHWYVQDDIRRRDCLKHRQAAWQARYREAQKGPPPPPSVH